MGSMGTSSRTRTADAPAAADAVCAAGLASEARTHRGHDALTAARQMSAIAGPERRSAQARAMKVDGVHMAVAGLTVSASATGT